MMEGVQKGTLASFGEVFSAIGFDWVCFVFYFFVMNITRNGGKWRERVLMV